MVTSSRDIIATPTVESVDDCAHQLYRRARVAGPEFDNLAAAVRDLHSGVRHLRQEAQAQDSLLHQPSASQNDGRNAVYIRQLTSLLEDSDFTLQQVDTILERYGSGGTARHEAGAEKQRKIDLIQNNVVSQKLKIDIFLDTVQLHHPAKSHAQLENKDDQQLELIKDKVDAVANKLLRARGESPVSECEEDVWQQFKSELEHEGFSSQVLNEHKVKSTPWLRSAMLLRCWTSETNIAIHRRSFVHTSVSWRRICSREAV